MQEVKEIHRILQDYEADPFELTRTGERILQLMVEVHATYSDLYANLGAELEEEAPVVVPSTAVTPEPAPELPPTPVSRRAGIQDLFSDEASSPDRNSVEFPVRPWRVSRIIHRSLARSRRLLLDSPPASPTEDAAPAAPTTPVRAAPIRVPGAPLRPRRSRRIDLSTTQPIRLFFVDSPPSTPVRNSFDVSAEVPRTPGAVRAIGAQENPSPLAPRSPRGTKRRLEDDRRVPSMEGVEDE